MAFHSVRHVQENPIWLNDDTWICRRHCPSARYSVRVRNCLLGCGATQPAKIPKPHEIPKLEIDVKGFLLRMKLEDALKDAIMPLPEPTLVLVPEVIQPTPLEPRRVKTMGPPWRFLDGTNEEALRAASISDLRKFARHVAKIIGASKIRGGKKVLIPLVLEAMGKAAQPA